MILSSAIHEFLNSDRDDHRWLKKLPVAEIDEALAAMQPPGRFNRGLRINQKVGLLCGLAYPRFAYWFDMGTGKTLLTLELLRYWWEAGAISRALIMVKSRNTMPTWEDQMKQYGFTDIPTLFLGTGSSQDKWAQLECFDEGVVFLAYPSAVAMCGGQMVKQKGGRKDHYFDDGAVRALRRWAQMFVLDESTNAAHHTSLTHSLCRKLAEQSQFCYGLAGRPFGRDPTMLWGQMRVIDQGESLGKTLGLFRAAFFSEQEKRWGKSRWAKDYVFRPHMMPKLREMYQHRSLTYEEAECADVPQWVPIIDRVLLSSEAITYYETVLETALQSKGDQEAIRMSFIQMRQLSSGFLGFKDENEESVKITFKENPKLDRLMELVDELPAGRKLVVFHEFTYSGQSITQALKKAGVGHIWLWSGTKDARRDLASFQSDSNVRVAVLNNKVGAYSIDGLQKVANYLVFYESPVSVLDREQAERRVRRQGQPRRVFQYDLVTKRTVDEKILAFHAQGKDLLRALRANPKEFLVG